MGEVVQMKTCFVYIIATDTPTGSITGPVKIGITANPDARLSSVRTGSPKSIGYACVIEAPNKNVARMVERAMHSHFADFRQNGEWFGIGPNEAAEFLCDFFDEFLLHGVSSRKIDWEEYQLMAVQCGMVAIRRKLAGERYMQAWESQAA